MIYTAQQNVIDVIGVDSINFIIGAILKSGLVLPTEIFITSKKVFHPSHQSQQNILWAET